MKSKKRAKKGRFDVKKIRIRINGRKERKVRKKSRGDRLVALLCRTPEEYLREPRKL
jgi:hypothetical protein